MFASSSSFSSSSAVVFVRRTLWHFSLQSDKLISRTKLFASRVDGRTEATSAPTPASGAECPPSLKRGRRGKTGRKEEQKSQGEIMSIVYKAGEYAGRCCCTRSTTFILYSDERNCPSTCYVSVFCSVSNRIGASEQQRILPRPP